MLDQVEREKMSRAVRAKKDTFLKNRQVDLILEGTEAAVKHFTLW